MSTVLVTGGSGFIGSHCILQLLAAGHEVRTTVRPGDTLRVESEILEVRPSGSKPDRGITRVRSTTLNQDGQPVLVQVGSLIVPRRPA